MENRNLKRIWKKKTLKHNIIISYMTFGSLLPKSKIEFTIKKNKSKIEFTFPENA